MNGAAEAEFVPGRSSVEWSDEGENDDVNGPGVGQYKADEGKNDEVNGPGVGQPQYPSLSSEAIAQLSGRSAQRQSVGLGGKLTANVYKQF